MNLKNPMKSLLKFISAVTVLAMASLTVGNVNAQQTVAARGILRAVG